MKDPVHCAALFIDDEALVLDSLLHFLHHRFNVLLAGLGLQAFLLFLRRCCYQNCPPTSRPPPLRQALRQAQDTAQGRLYQGRGAFISPSPRRRGAKASRQKSWDHALQSLQNGDIDFLPMMAFSSERDRLYDFSAPHTIAYDAFSARKNSSPIRSIDDLHGKTIIVMNGDQAHDYLRSITFVKSEQIILIDSLPQALQLLASGTGDTALMPKLVGLSLIKDLHLTNLEMSPAIVEAYNRPFSFAVKEGNQALLERLSQGLSIVKATGDYRTIYDKWFGMVEPQGISAITVLRYLGGTVLGFGFLGALLLAWTLSLRKQVAWRTLSLEKEIQERKDAEARLRSNMERLGLALDAAQAGAWEWDLDTNKNIWSEELWKVYGLEPFSCEPSYAAWRQVVHPADRATAEQTVQTAASQGVELNFEFRVLDRDGAVRTLLSRGRPMHDASGQAERYIGIVLYDKDRQSISFEVNIIEGVRQERVEHSLADGVTDYIIRHDAPFLANQYIVESLREHGITLRGRPLRSFLGVPIHADDEVIGVIALQDYEHENVYNEHHLELLTTIATQAASALKNARLFNVVQQELEERKRTEEALQKTTDLLRAIIEAAPTAVIGLDLDGKVQTVWNPAAEKMLGWSAQEAMGSFLPSVPVDKEEEFRQFREWIWSGKTLNGIEVRRRKRDGTPIDYSIYASPLHDSEGRITGNVAVLVDITERKQTEEDLRRRTREAETLREAAAVVASTLDQGRAVQLILDQLAHVVPYDSASIQVLEDDYLEIVGGRGWPDPAVVLGTRFPLSADNPNVVVVKQRSPHILGNAPERYPAFLQAPHSHIRSWLGVPMIVRDQVIGLLAVDSSQPDFYTEEHARLVSAFANQAAVTIENARLYDEVRRHADELEQKVSKRTADLSVANEQLQRLNRLKSEFVSNVSHELRTPLTNIISYLYLLDKGKPEKRAEYMATLHRERALLHRLIEDLLHLSRLDLGKVQPALTRVDVNRMVTLLVGDRAGMFADRGLALEVHVQTGLPIIQADEKMLIQVLTNLMTNAMHYTPRGGAVAVRTGLQIADFGFPIDEEPSTIDHRPSSMVHRPPEIANRNWVTLSGIDTGLGISPEEQARLFERFFRGAAARQTGAPGTGLGLAISHEILRAHGGRITVESQVGVGSTFTAWLPVDRR